MTRTCPECTKPFGESSFEYNMIRMLGACSECVDNIMPPEEADKRLAERDMEDRALRDVCRRIQEGIDANVTSGPQQVSLITIIRYGPCTVGEVAQRVGLDQSSITLHLKKFIDDDLVRTKPGVDRRMKMVEATCKARRIYTREYNNDE